MIHTVCKRVEAIKLKKNIKEIDPSAFIIVTTSSEIIGLDTSIVNNIEYCRNE